MKSRELPLGLPTYYFSCPGAAVLAWLIQFTPLTPNGITLLSMIIGGGGVAILVGLDLPRDMEAWIIFGSQHLRYMLDGVDGQIARLTHRVTPFGALFDKVADIWCQTTPIACLGALEAQHSAHGLGAGQVILLGSNLLLGSTLSIAGWLKDAYRHEHGPVAHSHRGKKSPLSRWVLHLTDVPIMITALAVAWGFNVFWHFVAAQALIWLVLVTGFLIKARSDLARWSSGQMDE
jgi:phosphatidylglycerophosphate synthase